jgi:FAD-dependent urate hydroxylase
VAWRWPVAYSLTVIAYACWSRRRACAGAAQRLPANAVQFDRAVEPVTVYADRVDAIDNHGTVHSAQVLVGADGHRSAVRRSVLDDAPAAEVGWITWQG